MTRTEHLLTILAEECAEVAQRASKALRFGLTDVDPNTGRTAAEMIVLEMNDLVAVYQMIAGPVASPTSCYFLGNVNKWQEMIDAKQRKVEKFLFYSRECGTLTEGPTDAATG